MHPVDASEFLIARENGIVCKQLLVGVRSIVVQANWPTGEEEQHAAVHELDVKSTLPQLHS
jgi:hypothetical protein